jgi:hypothetical protein
VSTDIAVTIPQHTLAQMVAMVGHAASTEDWGHGALRTIRFTIGDAYDHVPHYEHRTFTKRSMAGTAISMAATDRYRLAWATAGCTAPAPMESQVEFLLSATALRKMVAAMPKPVRRKPSDKHVPLVTLTVGDTFVRFAVGDGDYVQETTLAKAGDASGFPKLDRVVKFGRESDNPDHFALNPAYAAEMFMAFNKVRRWKEPIAVSSSGDNLPVRFSMPNEGEVMASGMLMPVKEG